MKTRGAVDYSHGSNLFISIALSTSSLNSARSLISKIFVFFPDVVVLSEAERVPANGIPPPSGRRERGTFLGQSELTLLRVAPPLAAEACHSCRLCPGKLQFGWHR